MFQQQPGRDILNLAAAYSGIEFPHETAMHHAVDGVSGNPRVNENVDAASQTEITNEEILSFEARISTV